MRCLIVFHSMTQAQNAGAILRRNGISGTMVKPPTSLGRGSCAYGLAVADSHLPAALRLLEKTNRKPLGIYEKGRDGCWREVLL